jgi:hypothetical protein
VIWLVSLYLAAASPAPSVHAARAGEERLLVAKKGKKKKKGADKPAVDLPPAHVSTNAKELKLKFKKRSAPVYLLEPTKPFEVQVTGEGMLILVLQRVLGAGPEHVDIIPELDASAMDQVKFSGAKNAAAKLVGHSKKDVTNAEPLKIAIGSGIHTVRLNPAAASANAVVEVVWMPGASKDQAPVAKDLPPPEPRAPPVAPPPPSAPTGGDDDLSIPGIAPPAAPPLTASGEKPPPPEPRTQLERDIRGGKQRDGVDDTYASVAIAKRGEPTTTPYHRVTEEKPFVFLVDGPGSVSVRIHRLVPAGKDDPGPVQVSILEDDVLSRTVTLDLPLSENWAVPLEPSWRLTSPKEYRIQLGARLSRFSFLASDMAGQTLAIRYEFVPQDKAAAMAVMGLGSDLGLAGDDVTGATAITEVEMRETVVERVVTVQVAGQGAAEETLGVGIAAGAVMPLWGGLPAPAAGLELSLPFLDGAVALAVEAKVERHAMTSQGVDGQQARIEAESLVWAIPIEAGPTFRLALGDSLRLGVGVHGAFVPLFASSTANGGEQTAQRSVWGAGGTGSAEIRLGVGWWVVEAGYTWVEPRRLGDALKRFSPSGVEVLTRFRFAL